MYMHICSATYVLTWYLQCVHFLTGKDYPIQASTKDEMIVWIKAIEDAAVSNHTHVRTSTEDKILLNSWMKSCNFIQKRMINLKGNIQKLCTLN